MNKVTIRRLVALAAGFSCAAGALAVFPADSMTNLPVATRTSGQTLPKVVSHPSGGCYISWFDPASGNFDVYIQRLARSGAELFPANGALVSNLMQPSSLVDYDLGVDGFGDAYVAFTDAASGTDRDARVTKMTSAGAVAWSTPVSSNADFEVDPRVVELVTGALYVGVTWARFDSAPGIYYQRLDSTSGAEIETPGGVLVAGDGVEAPAFQEMIATPDGAFIVSYVRDTRVFASPRHVRAQKYGIDGSPLWNGGSPVIVSANSVPIAHRPRLISDGAGGCIIAWHDSSAGGSNCFVQRIDAAGNLVFPAGGVAVSTNAGRLRFDPAIVHLPATDEVVVFFNERTLSQGDRGIYAQKLSAAGARQWTDDGLELLPVDGVIEGVPRAGRMGGDAVYFTLQNPSNGSVDASIVGGRVTPAGAVAWSATASDFPSSKGRLPIAVDPCGQAIAVWEDNRTDSNDIYAQNVNSDGTLGSMFNGADLDGDGMVGAGDLAILLGSWGFCGCCPADLDGDGVVGAADLAILLGSWG